MICKMNILALCMSVSLVFALETISYQIPENTCVAGAKNGVASFSGAITYGDPGQPSLPSLIYTFLLPQNADLSTVSVIMTDKVEQSVPGTFEVMPSASPTTSGGAQYFPEKAVIKSGKDMSVYSADAFFPNSYIKISSVGKLHACKLVKVKVFLFKYNPVQSKLIKLCSGSIGLQFQIEKNSAGINKTVPENAAQTIKEMICNSDEFARQYEISSALGESYYIISTAETISKSAQLSAFSSLKQKQGYTVKIINETTWGGGAGDKAANTLRTWLKSNYQTLALKYVLLIGDPTPLTGDVPMKMSYSGMTTMNEESPTDFFFAELSGNWDKNGDGKFGQTSDLGSGGADQYAELEVGRIPVYKKNYTELDDILLKLINYESAAKQTIQWRNSIILPMKPFDGSSPGWHLAEAVKKLSDAKGWSNYRIYDQNYNNTNPDKFPCTIANVIAGWTSRGFGVCMWQTHGNDTIAVDVMTSGNSSKLGNTNPSIVFQQSCLNAYPEVPKNLGYYMLRFGGITTVSATRVSWYEPGQTDVEKKAGTNMSMSYQFCKAIISNDKSVSEALTVAKNVLDPMTIYWMNWTDYVIYGDPSVRVSTCGDNTATAKTPTTDNISRFTASCYNNDLVKIRFSVRTMTDIHIAIVDAAGKEVATVLNQSFAGGIHTVRWDGRGQLAGGLYFVTFRTPAYKKVDKLVLIRY